MSKIKIYTFYTDSHEKLLNDFFLPSVPDSFETVVRHFPQECPSGSFHGDGWMHTMRRKVEYVIEAIKDSMGSWFIHADCDIQFFGDFHDDIKSELSDFDIVAMDDNMLCAGFFACRATEDTLELWEEILDKLEAFSNDQFAFNAGLIATKVLRYKTLPRFKYFNYMHTVGRDDVWNPSKTLHITRAQLDSILVHHANYTIGVEDKIKMMEIIRDDKAPNHNETAS